MKKSYLLTKCCRCMPWNASGGEETLVLHHVERVRLVLQCGHIPREKRWHFTASHIAESTVKYINTWLWKARFHKFWRVSFRKCGRSHLMRYFQAVLSVAFGFRWYSSGVRTSSSSERLNRIADTSKFVARSAYSVNKMKKEETRSICLRKEHAL